LEKSPSRESDAVLVSVVNQQPRLLLDGVATSLTQPQKPPVSFTTTRDCLSDPTGIERKEALSDMLKSPVGGPAQGLLPVIVTVALCESEPLDPLIVTV